MGSVRIQGDVVTRSDRKRGVKERGLEFALARLSESLSPSKLRRLSPERALRIDVSLTWPLPRNGFDPGRRRCSLRRKKGKRVCFVSEVERGL